MKKTFVEAYGLAVCFFAVACFVIVLPMAIWNAVGAAFPEFTIDGIRYELHRSDEAFSVPLTAPESLYGPGRLQAHESATNHLTGEELSRARTSSWDRAVQAERRGSVQGLVKNSIVLIISILIFRVHWTIARRVREAGLDRR